MSWIIHAQLYSFMLLQLLPTLNVLHMVIKSIKSWITHNYCIFTEFFSWNLLNLVLISLLVLNKVFTKEVLHTRLFCRYINKRGMYPIFNFHDENFAHLFAITTLKFGTDFTIVSVSLTLQHYDCCNHRKRKVNSYTFQTEACLPLLTPLLD